MTAKHVNSMPVGKVYRTSASLLSVIVVLVVALSFRVYYISQKASLEGDELTSLTLAYNATGWGDDAYAADSVYTAQQLRQSLYVDDRGGLEGYADDIASLWRDNRDGSHASLYYMALRTALIGQNVPDIRPVIIRAFGLNLLFFVASFVAMLWLLRQLFPGRRYLTAVLLAAAYLNPAAISTTLLVREYQLAEALMVAFTAATVALCMYAKSHGRIKTSHTVCVALSAAALVSAGYFNAVYAVLLCVAAYAYCRRLLPLRAQLCFPAIIVVAVILCKVFYSGFFNFLSDDRTTDVATMLSGGNTWAHLYYGCTKCVKMMSLDVLGLPLTALVAVLAIVSMWRGKKAEMPFERVSVCVAIWFVLAMILAPWKLNRYVCAAVPILAACSVWWVCEISRPKHKTVAVFAVLLIVGNTLFAGRVDYLNNESVDFPNDKCVVLYGKTPGDRNMLTLLIPHLSDGQQCVVVSNIADVGRFVDADTASVFADSALPELSNSPLLADSQPFNPWLSRYNILLPKTSTSER